jgi:SAM-dependent methyltransferase
VSSEDAGNPLVEFVERYLGDRRGQPTAILHVADGDMGEGVEHAFRDPAWHLVTAHSFIAGRRSDKAISAIRRDAWDVVVASDPLLEHDFPWVAILQLARGLRPDGFGCFALNSGQPGVGPWPQRLDQVVALVEWANLEALGLIGRPDDALLVSKRPVTTRARRLVNRGKLGMLRAASVWESRRRSNDLQIRRDQRRGEAREYALRDLARTQYKETWQQLSNDVNAAKLSVAGTTDEKAFRIAAETTIGLLESTTGLNSDDVVLEIGAGVGRVGPAIAPRVKRWIATDVSANMLQFARDRCSGLENVDFIEISGWDLAPIPDESVDLVYCTVVFPHLDEWERFNYVREAMRILRPGGRIYVDGYNLCADPGWTFFIKQLEDFKPYERPPNISKSSTPEELESYLRRAGVVDVRVLHSPGSIWVSAHGCKPAASSSTPRRRAGKFSDAPRQGPRASASR